MNALLALWDGPIRTWGFADLLILLLIIVGCCAVALIAARAMEFPIPQWLIQIVGVVAILFVAILAIRMIASM